MISRWFRRILSWWREKTCKHEGFFGVLDEGRVIVQCPKCGKIREVDNGWRKDHASQL